MNALQMKFTIVVHLMKCWNEKNGTYYQNQCKLIGWSTTLLTFNSVVLNKRIVT